MSDIGVRQLRTFLAIAEARHFGRAAAALVVTQPALSQQLAALERAIGAPLFRRRPSVVLTSTGEAFLAHARAAVARLDQAVAAGQRAARGEAGPLTVGFAASAILTPVAKVLHEFRSRFPDATLDLTELPPDEETAAVASGLVDVAFVREIVPHPGLRQRVVAREPFVVLVPRTHALAARAVVRPERLAGEPFVHFSRHVSPALYDQVAAICSRAGFSPNVVQHAREWLTELSLVHAGIGVAIVPASVGRLKLQGIRVLRLSGTSQVATVAICHRETGTSALADAFVETTRRVLP